MNQPLLMLCKNIVMAFNCIILFYFSNLPPPRLNIKILKRSSIIPDKQSSEIRLYGDNVAVYSVIENGSSQWYQFQSKLKDFTQMKN